MSRVEGVLEQLATSRARLGEVGVGERERLVRAVEHELEGRAVLEREALVGGGGVVGDDCSGKFTRLRPQNGGLLLYLWIFIGDWN